MNQDLPSSIALSSPEKGFVTGTSYSACTESCNVITPSNAKQLTTTTTIHANRLTRVIVTALASLSTTNQGMYDFSHMPWRPSLHVTESTVVSG